MLKAIESYKRQNCSCRGWCCINHVKYGWRISESGEIWSNLEQISSSVWFSFLLKWQHPDGNDCSPYLFHVCYCYWKCFYRNERIISYYYYIFILANKSLTNFHVFINVIWEKLLTSHDAETGHSASDGLIQK